MNPIDLASVKIEPKAHLGLFQELMSLPRETVPQLSAAAARKSLASASAVLGLEFKVMEGVVPTFLLLPPEGAAPSLTMFATWHAETHPVYPAAVEGAERLALSASVGALAGLVGAGIDPPALIVAPGAAQGSLPLEEHLVAHRTSLQGPVAFWPRISPTAPRRRRVFLGARGRVVLAVRGEGANGYAIRDQLVQQLSDEAYGPRPLDFELLRKLAQGAESMEFLEETLEDPEAVKGLGEAKLKSALFEPRGTVHRPQVRHPDRPQAWIIVDLAESMDPADVLRRAQAVAGDAKIEMVEGFLWDRLNIHHPAIQAEIRTAKSRSEGADIWPMAPWVSPSGIFTKALGTPLAEWSVPLPPGTAIRFPSAEVLEAIERELAELLLRAVGALRSPAEES